MTNDKAMQRIWKLLFYIALFPATLGLCGWQGWMWWSWASAPPATSTPTSTNTDKTVQIRIPSGTSATQIGQDLESAGLIRSADAWNIWVRWLSLQNKAGFKAGTYQLSPTQSLSEIAAAITTGNEVQRSFTIPEGWSLKQMAAYFESQGFFSAQDFIAAATQVPRDRFPWLPSGIPHLEGFLYPDTYQVAVGAVTPDGVINQMLKRFEEVALPVYQTSPQKSQFTLLQ